jgi:demethoxyubiquinone hydroxylase (CLK1/Coq7/Cat5 family)
MVEEIQNTGVTEKTEQYIQDHADELIDEIDQFDEEVQEDIINNL